jgi:hypothetical protein
MAVAGRKAAIKKANCFNFMFQLPFWDGELMLN